MPFLGIFNVKSKISGSWEPSPTARPWAEIKECRGAAGRWDHNKKPFLWAQWDELGKGSRKKGEPHFTVRGSTKKALFRLFIERAISPVVQPFPCFEYHSVRGAFLLKSFIPGCWKHSHVLLPERILPHSGGLQRRAPAFHCWLHAPATYSALKAALCSFPSSSPSSYPLLPLRLPLSLLHLLLLLHSQDQEFKSLKR